LANNHTFETSRSNGGSFPALTNCLVIRLNRRFASRLSCFSESLRRIPKIGVCLYERDIENLFTPFRVIEKDRYSSITNSMPHTQLVRWSSNSPRRTRQLRLVTTFTEYLIILDMSYSFTSIMPPFNVAGIVPPVSSKTALQHDALADISRCHLARQQNAWPE